MSSLDLLMMVFVLFMSLVALSSVAVKAAPTQSEEIVTATEGDNVTLASGVDINTHGTLSDDNNAVLLTWENRVVSVQNNRILWDSGTSSIIITSAQMEDSKTYHLQTYPNGKRKTDTIRLNVTERLHQVPEDPSPGSTPGSFTAQQRQRGRLGVYISLGLIVAVASAFSLIICWKKRTHLSSACCGINDTGADSSGSTSRSDSVEEKEMEDQLMSPK